MNSEQEPLTPVDTNPSASIEATETEKKSLKMPIILILWPPIAGLVLIIMFAITAAIAPVIGLGSQELSSGVIKSTFNIVLILVGLASITIVPVSIITGLVLLVQRLVKNR